MSAPVAEGMSHDGEDDVALVVRTLAGDRAAFGTLVQRYEEPVRRVARAVLHDVPDADDAAQDTFLTALMKLDRYDQRRPFRPWLLRIATNTAIDRRRHRALRLTAPLGSEVSTSDPGPDVAAERAALQERLRAALQELPERYRIAIVLFDVEGFAHAEIAEILGVAVGTVRSSVFHARRHLRELLADWKE
jgi:RNA polymerase sigma-70 factor (ECF subfamily)